MHANLYRSLLFLLVAVAFFACRKEEEFTNEAGAHLSFSADTVFFDTVFTQFGTGRKPLSVTKQLRVTNTNEKAVRVNIRLAGNQFGVFRLNIDGNPTNAITGLEIRGKDSIVIFVQVYLQPGGSATPFVVDDRIIFETNGTQQSVTLRSFGQDANYVNFGQLDGHILTLDCATSNLHWTKGKPYVIYDSILVPRGCTLTIDAGVHIYSHVKSAIFVAGTLVINGTLSDPVILEGDRLEPDYKDVPGQWIGIRFLTPSSNNIIQHAVIKNGLVGVEADSASVNGNPKLVIRESYIQNMSAAGLVGYTASIVAINNLVSNCGQFTFLGAYGGDYKLYHNTFVTLGFSFNRQNPTFLLDNSPLPSGPAFALNAVCINNIIWGNNLTEFQLNGAEGGNTSGTLTLQNNLVRLKPDDPIFAQIDRNGNILNKDPEFENPGSDNYELKEASPAKGKGFNDLNISSDIKGHARKDPPSMGCYE